MNRHLRYTYLCCLFLFTLLSIHKAQADCTGRDIIFTNIIVTNVTPTSYEYSYTIKNIGTEDIAFNQLAIQNYVSTDDQVGGDAAGGGAFINHSSTDILSPGETYSGVNYVYPFPENPQSSYPYIIAHIYLSQNTECDETNNYIAALIQVETSVTKFSPVANATVNWNNENKSFLVSEWQGNSSSLKYSVYNSSGVLMLAGNVQKNESTPLHLQNGYYILYLSDGEKIHPKRIVY